MGKKSILKKTKFFSLCYPRIPTRTSDSLVKSVRVSALFTQCPAIQYKLGPERLTQLGNSNVLCLPVPRGSLEKETFKKMSKKNVVYFVRLPFKVQDILSDGKRCYDLK